MPADDDLARVEERLREYVLDHLARPKGSVALEDVKNALGDVVRAQLEEFKEEARATLQLVREDLPGRVEKRLASVEGALKNDMRASAIEMRLQGIEEALEALGAPSRHAGRTAEEQRKGSIWAGLRWLGIAVVIGAFVVVVFLILSDVISRQQGNVGAPIPPMQQGAERGRTAEAPPAEERGWTLLLRRDEQTPFSTGDRARPLRAWLCEGLPAAECTLAQAASQNSEAVLQAGMEALRREWDCPESMRLDVDGVIGEPSIVRFHAISRCVAASNHQVCADGACNPPDRGFDLQAKDRWMPPTMNWALRLLGATEER